MIANILHDAYDETIRTFFVNNKANQWPDTDLIFQVNDLFLSFQNDAISQQEILNHPFTNQFLSSYDLSNRIYQTERSEFINACFTHLFPKASALGNLDFDKARDLVVWFSNELRFTLEHNDNCKSFQNHISGISKILTLFRPNLFCMYDQHARGGLSKLNGNRIDYTNNYHLFFEHWHKSYLEHKGEIDLFSHISNSMEFKAESESFENDLNSIGVQFASNEILCRRMFDKVLMELNN